MVRHTTDDFGMTLQVGAKKKLVEVKLQCKVVIEVRSCQCIKGFSGGPCTCPAVNSQDPDLPETKSLHRKES
jgi:hypothetical protein